MLPDTELRKLYQKGAGNNGGTEEQFIRYIKDQREKDPDVLDAIGPDNRSQLSMMSSGAGYEEAKIIADMTNSYITTDLKPRWMEVELDRANLPGQSAGWSAFSKAFGNAPLKSLNNVAIDHALTLRKERRLESLRAFLHRVWKEAVEADRPFGEENAGFLAGELKSEIDKAEVEWDAIGTDLVKMAAGATSTGLLAGGMIASGQGMFLAAAMGIATMGLATVGLNKKKSFPLKYPAAFFLDLDQS